MTQGCHRDEQEQVVQEQVHTAGPPCICASQRISGGGNSFFSGEKGQSYFSCADSFFSGENGRLFLWSRHTKEASSQSKRLNFAEKAKFWLKRLIFTEKANIRPKRLIFGRKG